MTNAYDLIENFEENPINDKSIENPDGQDVSISAEEAQSSDKEMDFIIDIVRSSDIFDADWYLLVNTDVATIGMDPVIHYVKYGAAEGRNPSPSFDTKKYIAIYPSSITDGQNPIAHFVTSGQLNSVDRFVPLRDSDDEHKIQELRSSGLFDNEWYLQRYPDVACAGIDPLEHYMRLGANEGKDPNPVFSTTWYLKANADVAAEGVNPLYHYFKYGIAEGRHPHPLFDATWYNEMYPGLEKHGFSAYQHYVLYGRKDGWLSRAPMSGTFDCTAGMGPVESIVHSLRPKAPSIAVVAHVFYADLAMEICDYLSNIPYIFTALVTVPNEVVGAAVNAAFTSRRLNCVFRIKVSENRGRNFAPWLVEFRDEILKHELFIHIHSKKSLRTGSEQSGWRTFLFDGLLGSESLVSAIIGKFVSDPKVGLIYTPTVPEAAPWYHNWLGTNHRHSEFFSRLGIKEYQKKGILDFPVGSMFWARTSALKPLLDYSWSYDHFEPEPSHHDGTLAHTIERSISQICKATGHDYMEFDIQNGIARRNWSEKLLHRYMSVRDFAYHCAEHFEISSFDFYDTIVSRRCISPDDVHNYIGWILHSQGHIKFESEFIDVRKRAEEAARKRSNGQDVDINDIYDCFQECCSWTQLVIVQAKGLELRIERSVLTPRKDVVQLIRQIKSLGKRVIIVSDSYMPRSFFVDVLNDIGLNAHVDALYVSCDVGLRKDQGTIWDFVLKAEGGVQSLVHFGDNQEADVRLPVVRGLAALHFLSTVDLADVRGVALGDEWKYGHPIWRKGALLGPVVAKIASNAFPTEKVFRPIPIKSRHDLGYIVFGPIVFSYVSWLIRNMEISGATTLLFLAREGYLLSKMYNIVADFARQAGKKPPEGKYFYVSRRPALAASLAIDYEQGPALMNNSKFKGNFAEFLKQRIGFTDNEPTGFDGLPVDLPADIDYVREVMIGIKDRIVPYAESVKTGFLDYYRNIVTDPSAKVAVADLGYSGTIQSAMQTILGKGITGYYFVTSRNIVDVFKRGGRAFGYYSEADSRGASYVKNYSMLLEAFLTAPHGQVVGYGADEGGPTPIFLDAGESQRRFKALEEIHSGIESYIRDLIASLGTEIISAEFDPTISETMLKMLIEGQLHMTEEFWSDLYVEDSFCGNGELKVANLYGLI